MPGPDRCHISNAAVPECPLSDSPAVVQHKLYWAATTSADEARYLEAVLNSRTLADRVAPYQSRGQFGARDFDKYVWYLPIPEYDPAISQHMVLAQLGERAEQIAGGVALQEPINFQTARRSVREALEADGVADEIEALVALRREAWCQVLLRSA